MRRKPSYDNSGTKKGLWSPEEDKKLGDYIARYGIWNWRELPKFAGLARCGKSCRLRWMNYLRLDITRGSFTKEEEDIIIKLHEVLGNKWSAISTHLHGRTDTEIKIYWHTHLKKRLNQNQSTNNLGMINEQSIDVVQSVSRSYSLNNPLLEAHLRSLSSKTFSDSESHSRSFSSIAISTQYTSSCPSSPSSVRSFSSETISTQDSESYALSFSSETISTQYSSSGASSASSVRKEWGEESLKISNMKHLRFLSLEGISRIKELPISFSKLANLESLVLRACPDLENIPGEIGLLKNLRHLDVSKCYLLHHMPKEISNLLELLVLEGFVVGNSMEKEDSCTLEHLAKLTKLRELSIYTRRKDFPVISDLRDLNRLKNLHNLKIEWGGGSVHKSENMIKVDNSSEESSAVENDASPELPPQLETLDLRCLPQTSAPDWLRASKLNKIKNLHIEGGPLSDLGQLALQEKSEWQVEILRLKFVRSKKRSRENMLSK
ncbi:hypothetical protein Vadar_004765 [Vaccinium darrowii]|uniref:Uncharacterized protein n=1 Tax=Vaccinium darrowii TaxID=229202 RepID=A0ACB7XNL3_9ERIC|nr:hypothetical protein Vadar_004765 [Vaccinium darrowii]